MADPQIIDQDPQPTAVVADTIATRDMTGFFDRAFPLAAQTAAAQGIEITGGALALYRGMPAETVTLEAGFPTATPIAAAGDVTASTLPVGRVATAVHIGPYSALPGTWGALLEWTAENGHTPTGVFWEVYVSDPTSTPADELRTELFLPLA